MDKINKNPISNEEYKRRTQADYYINKYFSLSFPNGKCSYGQCLGSKFIGYDKRGIPDFQLTLRGTTGKVAKLNFLEHRADWFETEEEAIEHTEKQNERLR